MSDDFKIHAINSDSNRLLELKLDPLIFLNLIFQVEYFLQVTVYRIQYIRDAVYFRMYSGHDSSNFSIKQAFWARVNGFPHLANGLI